MTEGRATAHRMWILDSPMARMNAADLSNGATGVVEIPLPSYLIEHERGLVMFDTGMSPDAIDKSNALYRKALATIELDFPDELRVENQLENLGFSPTDVSRVITSHSHIDHVGALHLFPHAQHYIGQDEIRYAFWPDERGGAYYDPSQLEPLRSARWSTLPKGVDHDLFGDQSVVILSTPGHTLGHLSLSVRLPSRNVIITADAAHLREHLEHDTPGAYDYNSFESIESIRRLKRIAEANEAPIIVTHDPEDWAAFPHAPEHLD